jgi:hypothetical protein
MAYSADRLGQERRRNKAIAPYRYPTIPCRLELVKQAKYLAG